MRLYKMNKPKRPYTKKYTNCLELEPEDTKTCAGCGVRLAEGEMVRVARVIIHNKDKINKSDKLGGVYCYDCQNTKYINVTGHLCLITKIERKEDIGGDTD